MPQAIIYLDEVEDKIVKLYSTKWVLSKHLTVKKMIRYFGTEAYKDVS